MTKRLKKTLGIILLAVSVNSHLILSAFNIERATVIKPPNWGNDSSRRPSMSADGRYIAFKSEATNLVNLDTNCETDVFVYDSQTGTIEIVSVNNSSEIGNEYSYLASISADGRYVAFTSYADNLVPGDTNGGEDIFVFDRQADTIERVSVNDLGVEGNNWSYWPSISGDGRYVAFSSWADNLAAGDINGTGDIFVYDRQTGTIERVSVNDLGAGGTDPSDFSSISGDGRYVAFESWADNLVAGDNNDASDIFVYDRQTDTIERVSVNNSGAEGNWASYRSSINADGRYVAFESWADNLVAGDNNDASDIFVYDRQTDTIERVSVNNSGAEGNWASNRPSINADGRYVAFMSAADNLVYGDSNGTNDIFVCDRLTNTVQRVSVEDSGEEGDNASQNPSISADGRFVAFDTRAENLAGGLDAGGLDINGVCWDVYRYDRQSSSIECININYSLIEANDHSYYTRISGDGSSIACESYAFTWFSPWHCEYSTKDILINHRWNGVTEQITSKDSFVPSNDQHCLPCINYSGRFVAFESISTVILGLGIDTNGVADVYVFDRQFGFKERVSVNDLGNEGNGASGRPSVDADGRYVAFESEATNLVAGDTNGIKDIFVYDRQDDTIERVSVDNAGQQGNGNSSQASINADGQYVAFVSAAANLVSGDTNGIEDIFVYDRTAGTVERVSVDDLGAEANGACSYPNINADGRYVSFASAASSLVSGDTNGVEDVFVYDRQASAIERVSVNDSGQEGNGASSRPWLSADGRFVAYESEASNLVAGDGNGVYDIFVYDRQSYGIVRVSRDDVDIGGNAESRNPSMSGDGWAVVFESNADNLVGGDANGFRDVFVVTDFGFVFPTPTKTPMPIITPTFTPTPVPVYNEIVVYPNPFNPGKAVNGTLKFKGLPEGVVVKLFTITGELVWWAAEQNDCAFWDGRNREGAKVSPGTYYYTMTREKKVLKRGKIVVLK